jgi:hypothetical protein
MLKKIYSLLIISSIISTSTFSQDDLSALADEALGESTEYALGSFFATRIMTGHSTEIMPKKGLDFRIHHRFDEFNSGFTKLWGLDGSFSYLSLEYGLTNRMNIGFGRANDGYFNFIDKVKLFRQSKGAKNFPVTIVYLAEASVDGKTYDFAKKNDDFAGRFNFTHQLLISRMFTPKLTLQLSPTLVHRNIVPSKDYPNDLYAFGIGGRYKITNTFSVNAEYFYVEGIKDLPNNVKYYNPVSVGVDIQVASHVFQIMLTNTNRMIEPSFLGQTTGSFFDNMRLGFNIEQVFTIGGKKNKP